MRITESKTIVKASNLGHPMKHLSDETVNKMIVGRIIGYATAVSTNNVEDKETGIKKPVKSLMGSFKSLPLDEAMNCVTSSRLGLPTHIMQPIIDVLEHPDNKGTGLIVEIAFDIGVERAKNAAGYSWYSVNLNSEANAASDPLMMLEKRLSALVEQKPALLTATDAHGDDASQDAPKHGKRGK